MAKAEKPWYGRWWAIVIYIIAGLIILSSMGKRSSADFAPQQQLTQQAQPTQPAAANAVDSNAVNPTSIAPILVSSCNTCKIEDYTGNYDAACLNATMSCLETIARQRLAAGEADPLCDKNGQNCLCFAGYNGVASRHKCYEELADRLCIPALTNIYCEKYQYYMDDLNGQKEFCMELVDQRCRKPGTTKESFKILFCEEDFGSTPELRENCYNDHAYTERNKGYCQMQNSTNSISQCEQLVDAAVLLDQIKNNGTQSDCNELDPNFTVRSLGSPYSWCNNYFEGLNNAQT